MNQVVILFFYFSIFLLLFLFAKMFTKFIYVVKWLFLVVLNINQQQPICQFFLLQFLITFYRGNEAFRRHQNVYFLYLIYNVYFDLLIQAIIIQGDKYC